MDEEKNYELHLAQCTDWLHYTASKVKSEKKKANVLDCSLQVSEFEVHLHY